MVVEGGGGGGRGSGSCNGSGSGVGVVGMRAKGGYSHPTLGVQQILRIF